MASGLRSESARRLFESGPVHRFHVFQESDKLTGKMRKKSANSVAKRPEKMAAGEEVSE